VQQQLLLVVEEEGSSRRLCGEEVGWLVYLRQLLLLLASVQGFSSCIRTFFLI
jgi:hypothetical protein